MILIVRSGTINAPIARKNGSIIERCIDVSGDMAITHYEVLEELEFENNSNMKFSIVRCFLETGRTHQIRVHMASIGHCLLGDDLYGGNHDYIDRQALHSFKVSFLHPVTGKIVCYAADIPEDIKNLI